jgi:cysteine desulfurase/selenocysteine lyase
MDIEKIRSEFPILQRSVNNKPLIYLDNTATSQTPQRVVEAIESAYMRTKANVHRGVHTLSQEATDLQEHTRRMVKEFINASAIEEVIFTRGTTEAINLVAASYGQRFHEGDEVILTMMEHHANIVPWQLLQARTGIKLRVVDIDDKGNLNMEQFHNAFNDRTVMACFCHVSNVLGTVNPVEEMVAYAHSKGVTVLVDGAQASSHIRLDMQRLDADFYVFSSHKMYGPTGVGVLYGKQQLLEEMPPYQGGGEMIKHVSFEKTTFADLPFKFEAGTPDFVDIAAFSKALEFINEKGIEAIAEHENELLRQATEGLKQIPGIRIYGEAEHKSSVLSFLLGKAHPYDVGLFLDKMGIAVRTGHHCAQPLMERFDIPGTVRASFAIYNTAAEVDSFLAAMHRIAQILV